MVENKRKKYHDKDKYYRCTFSVNFVCFDYVKSDLFSLHFVEHVYIYLQQS